jgi:hypothetical protein
MKHYWILFFIICGIIAIFIGKGAYSIITNSGNSNDRLHWGVFEDGSVSSENKVYTAEETQSLIQQAIQENNPKICAEL